MGNTMAIKKDGVNEHLPLSAGYANTQTVLDRNGNVILSTRDHGVFPRFVVLAVNHHERLVRSVEAMLVEINHEEHGGKRGEAFHSALFKLRNELAAVKLANLHS